MRQYVGARYVPIIDGEWNSLKEYEPLTIVTNQGNSYTSKTYVPIGASITDRRYWIITGNYNAQIEAYREETEKVKNLVETSVLTFSHPDDLIGLDFVGLVKVLHDAYNNEIESYYILSHDEPADVFKGFEINEGLYAHVVITDTCYVNSYLFKNNNLDERLQAFFDDMTGYEHNIIWNGDFIINQAITWNSKVNAYYRNLTINGNIKANNTLYFMTGLIAKVEIFGGVYEDFNTIFKFANNSWEIKLTNIVTKNSITLIDVDACYYIYVTNIRATYVGENQGDFIKITSCNQVFFSSIKPYNKCKNMFIVNGENIYLNDCDGEGIENFITFNGETDTCVIEKCYCEGIKDTCYNIQSAVYNLHILDSWHYSIANLFNMSGNSNLIGFTFESIAKSVTKLFKNINNSYNIGTFYITNNANYNRDDVLPNGITLVNNRHYFSSETGRILSYGSLDSLKRSNWSGKYTMFEYKNDCNCTFEELANGKGGKITTNIDYSVHSPVFISFSCVDVSREFKFYGLVCGNTVIPLFKSVDSESYAITSENVNGKLVINWTDNLGTESSRASINRFFITLL